VFHYLPLHLSAMGRRFPGADPCAVTESVSGRLVRLPFFSGLEPREQARVVQAIRAL
jgi:dTDP-4-amino-4,6-dideoxygalactose transaminase